jgi:hypothetical protein
MNQVRQRRFLSLLGLLSAAILGGAASFLLFAFCYDDDPAHPESKEFLLSAEGVAWLVVMMAQSAIWGVIAVLTWTKTLWLFRDFMHDQRLRTIGSLTLYLGAYMLLLWFPQQFIEQLAFNKLGVPLEQKVPLAYYYPVRHYIFCLIAQSSG